MRSLLYFLRHMPNTTGLNFAKYEIFCTFQQYERA
jgi:hypothetical protein